MAAYTVATSKHATLVAATVDTVTLSGSHDEVEVVVRAASGTGNHIYFTTDGSTPTSGGADTYVVVGVTGASLRVPLSNRQSAIKLICAATPDYTVTGI